MLKGKAKMVENLLAVVGNQRTASAERNRSLPFFLDLLDDLGIRTDPLGRAGLICAILFIIVDGLS